jgi:hypothetical protein
MSDKTYFEGFSEAEQEKYAAEAEQLYDAESVRESNRKWADVDSIWEQEKPEARKSA